VRQNLQEIAELPSERKLWTLRKFYAGNGGCLPPTDPRILSMTPEQIDLEFTHMAVDQRLSDEASGNKVYEDAEYENYDKDTDDMDDKLSDMPKINYNSDSDSWQDVD